MQQLSIHYTYQFIKPFTLINQNIFHSLQLSLLGGLIFGNSHKLLFWICWRTILQWPFFGRTILLFYKVPCILSHYFKSEFSYLKFEYCWRIILQGRLNGRDLYKMQKPRPERSNFSHFTTLWRNFLLLFNCFPFSKLTKLWELRIQQSSALFPLFSLFSKLSKHSPASLTVIFTFPEVRIRKETEIGLFKHWKFMKIQSI